MFDRLQGDNVPFDRFFIQIVADIQGVFRAALADADPACGAFFGLGVAQQNPCGQIEAFLILPTGNDADRRVAVHPGQGRFSWLPDLFKQVVVNFADANISPNSFASSLKKASPGTGLPARRH